MLKTKLAVIRAHAADVLVFAFEGIDDKTVYFHWLKAINPSLSYEVIVCNGKAKVLDFRDLLRRDLSGLQRGVYFFVDRDFDDLRGRSPGPDIYMTETYSGENELVNRLVLERILKMEFHCNGEIQCRKNILDRFDELYSAFLLKTRDHNYRIFLARRLSIANTKPWPDKVNHLAKVSLLDIQAADQKPHHVISLAREPSDAEIASYLVEFEALDRRQRYRGKFALAFFTAWLRLLGNDRNSDSTVMFGGLQKVPSNGGIPLDAIAAKSTPPASLTTFIQAIVANLGGSASSSPAAAS